MTELLTVNEAAHRFNVTPNKIRHLIAAGRLQAINVSVGTRPTYRIESDELTRFIRQETVSPNLAARNRSKLKASIIGGGKKWI